MNHFYKTIWVVDDVADVIYAFLTAFGTFSEYRVEYVATAPQVRAKAGDVVFLDLNGTKADSLRVPDGVFVFRMTGGFLKADLQKPFKRGDVERLLSIAKQNTPAA